MARKSMISPMVELMLPLFGVRPGRRPCVVICRAVWLASVGFIGFCHYRYFLSHLSSQHFFDLVDCLCSFLAHGKVLTKLVAFWANQRKLTEAMASMRDDWRDYADSEVGARVMAAKARISDRATNAIMILHTVTIVAYCTGIVLADVDVTDPTIEAPYINKLDIPFAIDTQRTYRFVLIAEYVHMILINWWAGIANAILITMILHVGGQLDILRCSLTELVPKEIADERASTGVAANKIIERHQKIISFSENIETLYTHIALLLFASNTMLICSLGFLIVTAIGTPYAKEQIVKSILFYTSTNLEAFIFCFAGEYLNNKSRAIGLAAYECAWYNLKPKDSRVLLFIILRSQRQLTLTAGKMMDLSLESFASIMNASGSYLSVLLAMQ